MRGQHLATLSALDSCVVLYSPAYRGDQFKLDRSIRRVEQESRTLVDLCWRYCRYSWCIPSGFSCRPATAAHNHYVGSPPPDLRHVSGCVLSKLPILLPVPRVVGGWLDDMLDEQNKDIGVLEKDAAQNDTDNSG